MINQPINQSATGDGNIQNIFLSMSYAHEFLKNVTNYEQLDQEIYKKKRRKQCYVIKT